MPNVSYDFSGWATKNDLLCSDGRVICRDAFKDCDGATVPLVWNHLKDSPSNVIGHALLENREDGVYAYCTFNDTKNGRDSKVCVEHGDVTQLSIWANQLKQSGPRVLHGKIREVSLVYAGANPGANIDVVMRHGEECEDEAVIYTGENIELQHAEEEEKTEKETSKSAESEDKKETIKEIEDIVNTMSDEQKAAMFALIGYVVEDAKKEVKHSDEATEEVLEESVEETEEVVETENEIEHSEGGEEEMKQNVFDTEVQAKENELSHSEIKAVIDDGKRYGSLRESALQHGITNIDYLFPEPKSLNNPPEWIKRDDSWVKVVMNGVHHTPFSRIKSQFANLTADEARARGYIKGHLKKEQVFTLLKRTTTPQTIYKKQKLDRDDVIDITDFDVIAWIKQEMRFMLDEEIARAILVGDGRNPDSDDKIKEDNIRPIWKDDSFYSIKYTIQAASDATEAQKAKAFIRGAVKSRKQYKGSGSPTLFTTEDVLTECLLLEDLNQRVIYDTVEKLATALRVTRIVTVESMEQLSRVAAVSGVNHTFELMGIIVNLADYNVGADKGGAINTFEDFDIDYNAQKYLIETRCSGALIKPYSAIALEFDAGVATGTTGETGSTGSTGETGETGEG